MKFKCECGEVIRDQTDRLPNKGYFRADEDDAAFADALDAAAEEASSARGDPDRWVSDVPARFERYLFECSSCGRLFVELERSPTFGVRFAVYAPEGADRGVLRSKHRGSDGNAF